MSLLSNLVSRMLNGKSPAEAASDDVSKETIRRLLAGDTVKLSTLREFARDFRVDEDEWLDLLVAWLYNEVGTDARKLHIEPKHGGESALRESSTSQVSAAMMLFTDLTPKDRKQIVLAMQPERAHVREQLHLLNEGWEKLTKHR